VQRGDVHHAVVAAELVAGGRGDGVSECAAVRVDDALGPTGGTGRVDDVGGAGGVDGHQRCGGRRGDVGSGEHDRLSGLVLRRVSPPGEQHRAQADPFGDEFQHRRAGVGDDHVDAGVEQHGTDQVRRCQRIDRHHHGPCAKDGVHGDERIHRLGEMDADPIAGLHADRGEHRSRARHTVGVLAPRQRHGRVGEGQRIERHPDRVETVTVDEIGEGTERLHELTFVAEVSTV
jgi:hypothetical protein